MDEHVLFIGDLPIQMVIFHSYVGLPEDIIWYKLLNGMTIIRYGIPPHILGIILNITID